MNADNDTSGVTGHTDPADESPWAMQLVVRVEKNNPPTRTAACEATAMAVVHLLATEEAASVWKPQIDRWLAGRIRKHCRRARGAKWDKIQHLPGVTVAHAGAEVRAFVPSAVDAIPPEVFKLQLTGRELDDPDGSPPTPAATPALVVSLQPDPWLPDGKAAAACGHAAQVAYMKADAPTRAAWQAAGFPVVVEQPDSRRFVEVVKTAPVVIRDAGFTVVESGTVTSAARWV